MDLREKPMSLYCSYCGTPNEKGQSTCSACGQPIGHPEQAAAATELSTPPNKIVNIIVAVLCGLYLIYPSLGVFELIPDALPLVGSLDEAAATTGLWLALSRLGLNPFSK